MVEVAISPHFKLYSDRRGVVVDSRTGQEHPADALDTAIAVYEDRVEGWFFRYIERLTNEHNAGFCVLALTLSQIEGIEQYQSGDSSENASRRFFKNGIKRLFSLNAQTDARLDELYRSVRCGLFHDGITRRGVCIENRFQTALEIADEEIRISPNKLFVAVKDDFQRYVSALKNPHEHEKRQNFERHWRRMSARNSTSS